ncbi:MAG TPA: hypothetical protein GXZ82_06550 [Firmicutes bacterium]|nr:hypothetical protein [Bacillota bacterium]
MKKNVVICLATVLLCLASAITQAAEVSEVMGTVYRSAGLPLAGATIYLFDEQPGSPSQVRLRTEHLPLPIFRSAPTRSRSLSGSTNCIAEKYTWTNSVPSNCPVLRWKP